MTVIVYLLLFREDLRRSMAAACGLFAAMAIVCSGLPLLREIFEGGTPAVILEILSLLSAN